MSPPSPSRRSGGPTWRDNADQAVAINSDVYGPPLFATALPGLLLFALGIALFGAAIARSGWLPRWAGVGLALGGVLFAIVGFLVGAVQPFGAALMAVSTDLDRLPRRAS